MGPEHQATQLGVGRTRHGPRPISPSSRFDMNLAVPGPGKRSTETNTEGQTDRDRGRDIGTDRDKGTGIEEWKQRKRQGQRNREEQRETQGQRHRQRQGQRTRQEQKYRDTKRQEQRKRDKDREIHRSRERQRPRHRDRRAGPEGEARRPGAQSAGLTCGVGLLLVWVGELLPLVLGPDPLLAQESGRRESVMLGWTSGLLEAAGAPWATCVSTTSRKGS